MKNKFALKMPKMIKTLSTYRLCVFEKLKKRFTILKHMQVKSLDIKY